jgi:hypothetical protein
MVLVAGLVSMTFLSIPVVASDPAAGTISATNRQVAWTGTPFVASNPSPTGCLGASDPSCDHFSLTVDRPAGAKIEVAIVGVEGDDLDLFVFYPDGTEVARSTSPTSIERIVFDHQTDHGAGPYDVAVQPWLVLPGDSYDGVARTTTAYLAEGRECLEAVPDAIGVAGVTDLGQTVVLEVLVLLDGVSRERAEAVFAVAAESYAPANIALVAEHFRQVTFEGTEGAAMIQQAKDLLRGARPEGIDIVYILTSKDITDAGDPGLVGLADCIGGVEWDNHAFAVGEDVTFENFPIGPFVTIVDGTAKVVAHEIGHLMGAHHHYANCVEGNLDAAENPFDLSPCTLMFNFLDFISLNFSGLNLAVVRGHAVASASP